MSKSGEEESTTSKYTAVPKPYSGSGNFREWRLRFTYCQEANGWSDEMALKKLPTLLEKVALVTFTRLSKDDKISLSKVLNKLEEEFAPEQSTAFDEFSNAHYNPTDSLDLYSYQLTELLDSSGLSLDEKSRDALLIAKFIASLPSDLQVDLRKSRESINSLQGALRMAKRLQAIQTTPSSLSPPVTTSSSPNPVPMVDTSNLPSVQLSNPLEKPDPAVAAIADLTEAIRQEQEMMVNFISRRGKGKGGKGRSRYGRYQYQRRPTRNAYLNNRRHQTHQAPWAPTCDYCGIPGHFWRECRRRLRDQGVTTNYGNFDGPRNGRLPDNRDRQPREVNGYTDNDVTMYDTSNLIDTVETRYTSENDCGTGMDRAPPVPSAIDCNPTPSSRLFYPITIYDNHYKLFIDTGSEYSLISRKLVDKLSICSKLQFTNQPLKQLYTADGDPLQCLGTVILPLYFSPYYTIRYPFIIVEHIIEPILAGRGLQRAIGLRIDQSTSPPSLSLPSDITHPASRVHPQESSSHASKDPHEAHVISSVHREPEKDHTTRATIPSHLRVLDVVEDLGWIAIYLTYDIIKKTKCFTVEIKKGTVKPMNMAEYKRYGRLHTKMTKCPKQDLEDSVKIWDKWQEDGKVRRLPPHSPATVIQNYYVVRGKRARVVLTFLYVNNYLHDKCNDMAFKQSQIPDMLLESRLYTSHATLDISDAFTCIRLGSFFSTLTDTRVLLMDGSYCTMRFLSLPYGVNVAPWCLETSVRYVLKLTPIRQPSMCKNYMDDILVANNGHAIDELAQVNESLQHYDFLISPRKILDIDSQPATDILGIVILNKHGKKYVTIGKPKDKKWKSTLQTFLNESEITYQNLHSMVGCIPKYPLYDPWLISLCYKFQSIASRERNDKAHEWSQAIDPGLDRLTRNWIQESLLFEPLRVPMHIDIDKALSIYVDSSKYALGYMVYQNSQLLHQHNEILPEERSFLNIAYKELVALRLSVSYISHIQVLAKRKVNHIDLYTDSKVVYNILKNDRVKATPAASRNHIELIRREYIITKELLTAIGCTWTITHVDGKSNPADRLTRHQLLDKFVLYNANMVSDEEKGSEDHLLGKNDDTIVNAILSKPKYGTDSSNSNTLDVLKWQPRPVTLEEVRLAQKGDPYLPVNESRYIMKNGLLHYRKPLGIPTLYIPPQLRARVLQVNHDSVFGGHCGARRLHDLISKVAYWPYMNVDCEFYTTTCDVCQRAKSIRPNPLQLRSLIPSYPLEVLYMDYLTIENQKILVLQDSFSKFAKIYIAQSSDGQHTANYLLDFFLSYGVPTRIFSDNGANLRSKEVHALLESFNIQHDYSPSRAPYSHGMIERLNSSLLTFLRTFRYKSDWKSQLPYLVFSYNITRNSTTGVSPFTIFFGRQVLPSLLPKTINPTSYDSPLSYLASNDMAIHDRSAKVERRLYQQAEARRLRHERQYGAPRNHGFVVGDIVYWYHGPGRTKLNSKWVGPYRVCGTHSSKVILCIENPVTTHQHYVHANALRLANVRPQALQVTNNSTEKLALSTTSSKPRPDVLTRHAPLLQPLNMIPNDQTTLSTRPAPRSDTTHSEDPCNISISSRTSEHVEVPDKTTESTSSPNVTTTLPSSKMSLVNEQHGQSSTSSSSSRPRAEEQDEKANDDVISKGPQDILQEIKSDKQLGTHYVMSEGILQRRSTRTRRPTRRYEEVIQVTPSRRKRKLPQQGQPSKKKARCSSRGGEADGFT